MYKRKDFLVNQTPFFPFVLAYERLGTIAVSSHNVMSTDNVNQNKRI